jgi:hypothetical protein
VIVQGQVDAVATVTEKLPPPTGTDWLVGLTVNPSCVAVNVWDATLIVPDRGAQLLLGCAKNVKLPFPVPVPGGVTVSMDVALLVAAQAHPAPAVTLTGPELPPVTTNDRVGGLSAYPHCVTVKITPAIVSEPARSGPEFDNTMNVTPWEPVWLEGDTFWIQLTLLPAFHAHPLVVITEVDPGPPAALMDMLVDVNENEQFGGGGGGGGGGGVDIAA